jgi:hypothetical protein
MTISHYIVSLVGIGYAVVGIQQWHLGNIGNALMWVGYAFSQIGLFMQLAK